MTIARSDGQMIGLAVKGLAKNYGAHGEVRALDSVDLEFPPGKCTVLLGPSGCGKTTVLRSIAGLVAPDAGRIEIGGTAAFDSAAGIDLAPETRQLGMVFQSYALWPHMTVAENIAYPLQSGAVGRLEIAQKVEAMLDWIGLRGLGGRYVHELSGGQQQRVSLGRAMVGSPRAILFDEPLSNLDARLREHMRMELLALRQKVPFTSIYVTHDLLEAMTLGDQVVVMRAGKVEQIGRPEDIFRRPRNRFVAEFVGIPNLVEGTIRGREGEGFIVDTALGVLRARGWRDDWVTGARCTLAIRATSLATVAGGSARVVRSAFQGSSSLIVAAFADAEFTIETFAEARPADGAAVSIVPTSNSIFPLLDD
jgi:iron(III) transport system ATP-binding protein